MAEIVSIDKAGRLVIPKSVRESLGISEGSKFLLSEGEHGRILLQKFDLEEIAARLEKEMKGKDVDAIVRKIRKETNEKVRKRYPGLFA